MKALCVAAMVWNACTEMRRALANAAGETGSVAVLGFSSGSSGVRAGSGGPKGDLGGIRSPFRMVRGDRWFREAQNCERKQCVVRREASCRTERETGISWHGSKTATMTPQVEVR